MFFGTLSFNNYFALVISNYSSLKYSKIISNNLLSNTRKYPGTRIEEENKFTEQLQSGTKD
jgi:hypothetical protein